MILVSFLCECFYRHECKHQEFYLTPDMVSAQFALVQQTTLPEDRLPVYVLLYLDES